MSMTISSAAVIVRRAASHDVGERELYVSVDGAPNEILRFRDEVRIPVAPGHHRLRVHNTWSRKVAEFEAAPGEEIRFSAANVAGKGYLMSAVFFGFALMHTELQREQDDAGSAGRRHPSEPQGRRSEAADGNS